MSLLIILVQVVRSPLDLGLHAPVTELHFAQLVGAHDALASRRGLCAVRRLLHLAPVVVDPVGGERAAARLLRRVDGRVLGLWVVVYTALLRHVTQSQCKQTERPKLRVHRT